MASVKDIVEIMRKLREKRKQGKMKETILKHMKGIIPDATKYKEREIDAAIRG